ncbi:MAG: hypothetical protein LBE70_03045 [Nitrososphaerota archaeon]|nr:hypothetical protein [Nitrososphaerota archaeon]
MLVDILVVRPVSEDKRVDIIAAKKRNESVAFYVSVYLVGGESVSTVATKQAF